MELRRWRGHSILAFLALGALVTVTVSSGIGSVWVPPGEVAETLVRRLGSLFGTVGPEGSADTIIWSIRLPRVLTASAVGATLAASGAVFQGLFQNPMADPYIIGSSAGASFGAALGILVLQTFGFAGFGPVPALAFAGALGATLLVYAIAKRGSRVPVLNLLLAGVAISSMLSALVSLLIFLQATDERLWQIVFWLMGGLGGASWPKLLAALPYMVAGMTLVLVFARDLNALSLGEDQAHTLGISVEATKALLLAGSSLATAAAVAVSGLIGFVGLIVPHGVRLLLGPDHRLLLPAAALTGAIFLLAADTVARTIISPAQLPVGIITALVGGPFFLYLLRSKGGGSGG